MADTAAKILNQLSLPGASIDIKRVKESPEDAFGNGCGIM